jgi:formylglycine-generating enzyme required for sulfatase activity
LAEAGVISNGEWEPYIQEFDGVKMALVQAGCFMMGSEDGESTEKPVHEVCFDEPFWIDVYEVTNELYGSAASGNNTWGNYCGSRSRFDDQPRICINWSETAAYCESHGARLPTEAEWEYAARGPDSLRYPWGMTLSLIMWFMLITILMGQLRLAVKQVVFHGSEPMT